MKKRKKRISNFLPKYLNSMIIRRDLKEKILDQQAIVDLILETKIGRYTASQHRLKRDKNHQCQKMQEKLIQVHS